MHQYSDNNKPIVRGSIDGNVFSIIGIVEGTLRKARYPDAARECKERCFKAGSYAEVLEICQEYVDFEL